MMNYRSKSYKIEARQFKGEPMSFHDLNMKIVKVYKTMRGWHVKHPGGMRPIDMNDWIITKPDFMIVTDAVFQSQFELNPEGQ